MMEQTAREHQEGGIPLGESFSILGRVWWKVVLLSLAVGALTLVVLLRTPNIYKSTAVITPAVEETKQVGTIGALASLGMVVGGPSKVEDLETLFKSTDLTVRVFSKHDLWSLVLPDKYDPVTKMLQLGWVDRYLRGKDKPVPPGDWDAIRASRDLMKVVANKRSGVLSITFETPSAEGSAQLVRHYLEEAKSRLQEEALEKARNNKKFVEEQIGKTVDALSRDRLYTLYTQELEKEMMARNREQFGFRIIDQPRVPDKKSGPMRVKSAIGATALSLFVFGGLAVAIDRARRLKTARRGVPEKQPTT